MRRMHNLWTTVRPFSNLNEKQLMAQTSNIIKKGLLSQHEIEEVRTKCEGRTGGEKTAEAQIRPEVPAEPTPTEAATIYTLKKLRRT